jgi:DNA-directed RNA polymerase
LELTHEKKNNLEFLLVESINNLEANKNELNNTIEKQHETFNKDREALISQKDEL